MSKFDIERFVDDCRKSMEAEQPHKPIRELLTGAMRDPRGILAAVGEPTQGRIKPLYRSPDLTIFDIVWPAKMTVMPHDHRMWALIGIYTGREDNIFWRRLEGNSAKVEAAGAKSLGEGDVTLLGRDIIHSVTNPLGRLTGAIHIYGGDFFAASRSEWDPESLLERSYDTEKAMKLFRGGGAAH